MIQENKVRRDVAGEIRELPSTRLPSKFVGFPENFLSPACSQAIDPRIARAPSCQLFSTLFVGNRMQSLSDPFRTGNDRFVAVERTVGTGHNRPLVIRSEFLPLDRLGWLVYGGQFELRFGSSRPEADGCRSQAAGVGSVSISRSIPCRLGQRRTSSARVPRRSRALTARAPAVFILSRVGCNLQLPVVLASGANAGDLPSIATPQRAPKRYIKPALIMKTSLSWNATSESPSPHSTLPTACQRPLSNGSR